MVDRSMMLTIEVKTKRVRGQGRPRFGKGRAYESRADKAEKALISEEWFKNYGYFKWETEPLEVTIMALRRLPIGTPKKIEELADTGKPDIDNIAKLVLDALNGVAFKDDSQIVRLKVEKCPRRRRDYESYLIGIREVESE